MDIEESLTIQDRVSKSMRAELEVWEKRLQKTPTIFKIPPSIRLQDEQAFEPEFVSIGPLHCENRHLQSMQRLKWRYLQSLLARPGSNSLEGYVGAVTRCWEKAKGCYAEELPDLTPDKWVEIMVLDGCYVVEFLIMYHADRDDPASRRGEPFWSNLPYVGMDLLRMENQIPFFVLQALFGVSGKPANIATLTELAIYNITSGKGKTLNKQEENATPGKGKDLANQSDHVNVQVESNEEPEEIHHFLHLSHLCDLRGLQRQEAGSPSCLRKLWLWDWCWAGISIVLSAFSWFFGNLMYLIGTLFVALLYSIMYHVLSCRLPPCPSWKNSTENIPSAKDLWEAGVQFKAKDGGGRFNISFNNGMLTISPWLVDKRNKNYLWNVMALEKYRKSSEDFTRYVVIMSYLASKPSDVEVLEKHRIIQNSLGSAEELISFFKKISWRRPSYASLVFEDVIAYYESKPRRWRARIWHDLGKSIPNFFSNPYVVVSVIVAGVSLALSGAAAVFNIIRFYRQPTLSR